MCCLFGLIDTKGRLSGAEKSRIISILAVASEARGTDATGYACNSGQKLIIEKHPLPAHRMKFRIPDDASIIMGHTRMTTQGSALKNRNNHPFSGKASDVRFALAHNGMLSNDEILRHTHDLPKSGIETDSYVAVQLIEKQKSLDLDSVKFMAEQVKGSFNFTILDHDNRLFIVKGNNPLCLYHFKKAGFYLYASTRPILEEAIGKMGYGALKHHEIPLSDGEILLMDTHGQIHRERFVLKHCAPLFSFWEPVSEESTGYRKSLLDHGRTIGIPSDELNWLHEQDFPDDDIEHAIFDTAFRHLCLECTGYFDLMEDYYYDYDFENCPWT